jgi:hypothetical protein
MAYHIYDVRTGEILRTVGTDHPATAWMSVSIDEAMVWADEGTADDTHYVVGGSLITRPVMDVPVSETVSVGEEWNLGRLPINTRVMIDDVDHGIVGGDDLILEFPAARDWSVELIPPFPYKPAMIVVRVI